MTTFDKDDLSISRGQIAGDFESKKRDLLDTNLTIDELKGLSRSEVGFIAKSHKLQDLLNRKDETN